MTTLTRPEDLLQKVLLHHAQLFRGLSLGYMHRALHEVDTESRARAESMADAYEIVATTLEASAQVEASGVLDERDGGNLRSGSRALDQGDAGAPPGSRSLNTSEARDALAPQHRSGAGYTSGLASESLRSLSDPKPPKRIKNPGALTALHSMDTGCLLCGNRPVSAHHLLSRALGGDDVSENLVLLCGDGTRGCHGFVERHDRDVCRLLRVSLSPEQIDYLVTKKSWDWLDSRYPETL